MSDSGQSPRFPRNKEELVRDMTLLGRLKDIRDSAQMEEVLAPKWWETAVGVVQFAAALGLLSGLIYMASMREDLPSRIMAFFFTLLVLSQIFAFEFMLYKIYHLRHAAQIARRQAQDLVLRIEALEKALGQEPKENAETEQS